MSTQCIVMAYIHTYIRTYIHTHTYVCTHIRIYIDTYIYIFEIYMTKMFNRMMLCNKHQIIGDTSILCMYIHTYLMRYFEIAQSDVRIKSTMDFSKFPIIMFCHH